MYLLLHATIIAAATIAVTTAGVLLCQLRREIKQSKGYWNHDYH